MHYAYLLVSLAGVASAICKEFYTQGGYCNRVAAGQYRVPNDWKERGFKRAQDACFNIHGGLIVPGESIKLAIPEDPCYPATSTGTARDFFVNVSVC
ncbi:hypothetical protein PtrV1_01670 [Pyrenophora tritici-repentis]|uniref:Uncharacterized protein n=1 Tax=Pyrenophora tritici-repentis TaxID=45151 RepID=A0A5M9LK83_9PLEO|nr:hypothetical protein PtrV1_01670 [Pyrenophora tritici-repentis]KAF7454402.1 hypothetical protein A1F99_016600 [Pyrenophora tritici-repentis]KAF7577522.1 hypothetical protein PtrM4_017620 [Pyrenophora tritici-repentis]